MFLWQCAMFILIHGINCMKTFSLDVRRFHATELIYLFYLAGMAFVEAFRQFQFRVGRDNFCSIHVSLVPQPNATGEHKTKPTQAS